MSFNRTRFASNWPARNNPYARYGTRGVVLTGPRRGVIGGRRRLGIKARGVPRSLAGYNRSVGMYGRFGTGRSRSSQVEKKFYDTALTLGASAGVASTTQATGALNLTLAQGTSANTRIGQKIIIKSIQVQLTNTLAAGATDTDILHIYLMQDTQANGALPAITDVFDAGPLIGTQNRNMANSLRFKMLKHWEVRLNADAGVATAFGGDIQQNKCYLKCNIPIYYNSNAGAIGEIKSNNLFMMYGSTQGQATSVGSARIRYTDM